MSEEPPLSIPTTDDKALRRHLQELGVRPGDHLAVHSRLISFGKLEGGTDMVLAVLREAVGPEGTVCVPTYTLSGAQPYSPETTPSEGLGPLPEALRILPGAIRSRCPMHNHAAIGRLSEVLLSGDGRASLGAGSDFEALWRAGFRLLLLGTRFSEGATFLHHLEGVAEVPYRRWLHLQRSILSPRNVVEQMTCRYYGRTDETWKEDFDVIEPPLSEAGVLARAACPFGSSLLVDLADLQRIGLGLLASNPYALVRRA